MFVFEDLKQNETSLCIDYQRFMDVNRFSVSVLQLYFDLPQIFEILLYIL